MELRHLRCFVILAEELHFGRAAKRLHMEQSPLSRAIKELEQHYTVRLFERNTRATRLTPAGKRLLEHAYRVLNAVKQAEQTMQFWPRDYSGQLRIALSDYTTPSRLPAMLALCREHEPEIEIRLFQVSQEQLIQGLHNDLYDAGFALSDETEAGLIAQKVWSDPLMVVLHQRHPLLAHKHIPLNKLLEYFLVLPDPETCKGYAGQVDSILQHAGKKPMIAERVTTFDLMLALASSGLTVGVAPAPKVTANREHDVVMRPLADRKAVLTTYLLRLDAEPSPMLARYIELLASLEPSSAHRHRSGSPTDAQKEIEP